jgi:hypothetical protein
MPRFLRALALVFVALVLTACPRKPILELHSGRLQSASPLGIGFELEMRVNNENAFDVKIRNVRASVVIADRYALPQLHYNPDQWLGAGQTTIVRVPMVLPWPLVAPLMATTVGRDRISYNVRGLIDVTAVRMLGIEKNDYAIDEKGSVSRAQLVVAAARGALTRAGAR